MESLDIGSILSSFTGEPSRLTGIVIASLLFGATLLWLKKDKGAKNDVTLEKAATKTTPMIDEPGDGSKEDASTQAEGDGKLRNVFSVKQKPIATGNGSSGRQAASDTDRPFESSYYFAHNKHSTGGGYKDGLRAEDYVMNGPRLLSKGGISVDDEPNNETSDRNDSEEGTQSEKISAKERPKPKLTASTPITKYMWDDDGSGNVAKIHIDSLPISSTQATKWENLDIVRDQVDVRLIGENNEGLYIGITQEEKRYHLHVSKMYGEAVSAKFIVKKHKLLVKITKKEIPKRFSKRHATADDGVWTAATKALGKLAGGGDAKEEFISVAWPRLSASSAGGLGGGKAEIDEKIFKDMDAEFFSGDDILKHCS